MKDFIQFAKDFRLVGFIFGICGGLLFGWKVAILGLGMIIIATIFIKIFKLINKN